MDYSRLLPAEFADSPFSMEKFSPQWKEGAEDVKPGTEGKAETDYHPFVLDLTKEPQPIPFLFRYKGDLYFARSTTSLIKGKSKSGKSAAALLFIAAALKGRFEDIETEGGRPYKILLADMEQDRNTLLNRARAIMKMAGIDVGEGFTAPDNLCVLSLLACGDKKERMMVLGNAIKGEKPDFVVLDGLADLIDNFNDEAESVKVVEDLTRMAADFHTHIVMIMHTNKPKDDNNAKGHLGSLGQQKAAEVYVVAKDAQMSDVAHFQQDYSRFKPVAGFDFCFLDEFALSIREAAGMRDVKVEAERLQKAEEKIERLKEKFSFMSEHSGTWSKMRLRQEMLKRGDARGTDAIYREIDEAVILGVITKRGKGKNAEYWIDAKPDNAIQGEMDMDEPDDDL
jgi:hypothetical protein